jgi:hypothetical protein
MIVMRVLEICGTDGGHEKMLNVRNLQPSAFLLAEIIPQVEFYLCMTCSMFLSLSHLNQYTNNSSLSYTTGPTAYIKATEHLCLAV